MYYLLGNSFLFRDDCYSFLSSQDYSLFQFCAALLTLLMMTAESMLSKRPALRITGPLFFLQLFSLHIYCSPKFRPKFVLSGTSAPARSLQYREIGTSPKGFSSTSLDKKPPRISRKSSCPTTYHWSNSNVTMVTTDGRSGTTELARSIPKHDSVGKIESKLMGLNILANSPPPVSETGAFVRSSATSAADRASSPFLDASSLPFFDLMNVIDDEDDDDTASSCSTEMNSDR